MGVDITLSSGIHGEQLLINISLHDKRFTTNAAGAHQKMAVDTTDRLAAFLWCVLGGVMVSTGVNNSCTLRNRSLFCFLAIRGVHFCQFEDCLIPRGLSSLLTCDIGEPFDGNFRRFSANLNDLVPT